ncbi:MAG: hypothetical protein M4D80_29115 [Myxococcota bacterium]|nr:hypothetical protein [Deltaproteobacteria bacterium]MDQ3339243.1 hypothetical protein [Myxococcota bacterium]
MRMVGLGAAILISVVLLLVVALVGRVAGYDISLGSSILATVVLTVVVNLVLGAFARRNRRY